MTRHNFNIQIVLMPKLVSVEAKNIDDAKWEVRRQVYRAIPFALSIDHIDFLSHSQNPNTENEQ